MAFTLALGPLSDLNKDDNVAGLTLPFYSFYRATLAWDAHRANEPSFLLLELF